MNEQDKKLNEIRARVLGGSECETTSEALNETLWLLDIIARQEDENKAWRQAYGNMETSYDRLAAECKAKDARIEALERAIYGDCGYCIHEDVGADAVPCAECISSSERTHYEFNEGEYL